MKFRKSSHDLSVNSVPQNGTPNQCIVLTWLRRADPAQRMTSSCSSLHSSSATKHVATPRILNSSRRLAITRRTSSGNVTVLEARAMILYSASNSFMMLYRINGSAQSGQRAGKLFAINLTLLSVVGRTSLLIDKVLQLERAWSSLAHR